MPDEYRCWSENPFIPSHNGTSDWWIFENFPNLLCKSVVWQTYGRLTKEILFPFVNSFPNKNGVPLFLGEVQCFLTKTFPFLPWIISDMCQRHKVVFYILWLRRIYPHLLAQDFIRVVDDMDAVFLRNQSVKCSFFLFTQICREIRFDEFFN